MTEPNAAPPGHTREGPAGRRSFLCESGRKTAGLALAAAATPLLLTRRAHGLPRGRAQDTLVQIFLRGGMDGLSACVPYNDPELYKSHARPTTAPKPPGTGSGFDCVDLDGQFGLHPSMAPLLTPYSAGALAFVHATGSTNPTRSHFDAMKYMEFGIPDDNLSPGDTGWLARHLQTVNPKGAGPIRGFSVGYILPNSLAGAPAHIPVADPANFTLPGDPGSATARRAALTTMYQSAREPLQSAAQDVLDSIDHFSAMDFANYVPANGAVYPSSPLGSTLLKLAVVIKNDLGIESLSVDVGGWDTHSNQGNNGGAYDGLIGDVAASLEAFYLDLLGEMNRVTTVVMSEFGRRVNENGASGTDHGHGNCMMVMGGNIAGGQVLANWPTLAPGALDQGDLAITIDYRDILAEIVQVRLGNPNLASVFPNHSPTFQGITTG